MKKTKLTKEQITQLFFIVSWGISSIVSFSIEKTNVGLIPQNSKELYKFVFLAISGLCAFVISYYLLKKR